MRNGEQRTANVQLSTPKGQRSSVVRRMAVAVAMTATFAVTSCAIELGAVWVEEIGRSDAYLRATTTPKAIVVPVFGEGKATYASNIELFKPEKPGFTPEQLRALATQCRAKGVAVYGAVDLLHWVPLGKASETDVLATHPDYMEINLQRSCNEREEGRFASPFNADVRELMLRLVREIATKLDMLDGLVINCRLTPTEMLGYSEPARVAFILAESLDPIDLLAYTNDPEEKKYTEGWYRWRLQTVTAFLGEVVTAYRQETGARDQGTAAKGQGTGDRAQEAEGGKGRKRVLLQAFADTYRWPDRRRASAAQDWLDWILNGYVDGVLLEADWSDAKRTGKTYQSAIDLVKRTGRTVDTMPLIVAESTRAAMNGEAIKSLERQGCERIAVRVVPRSPVSQSGTPSKEDNHGK